MTLELFIFLLSFGAVASGLFTEAIKASYENGGKTYSSNMIALVVSLIVGCIGTAITYIFMGIKFDATNIICIILMGVCVWMGSMIGYDKIIQLIKQLGNIPKGE